MKGMILHTAITDYNYIDANRISQRKWELGKPFFNGVIYMLEYNLTFKSVDVYIDNGDMIRIFNVKELIYKPNAEEKNLSAHERAVAGVEVTFCN